MHYLEKCASTNDVAWALVDTRRAQHGTALRAGYQTAGRGQRGASWQAAPGESLLLSVCVRPQGLAATNLFALSAAVALAVREALHAWAGIWVDVKWPNDLYAEGKKLGGMLLETRLSEGKVEWAVAGLGLNVLQGVFGDGLQAVSLAQLTETQLDIGTGAEEVARHIAQKTEHIDVAATLAAYEQILWRLGIPASYAEPDGKPFIGTILGITPYGHLRLSVDEVERVYDIKEVGFL